MALKGGLGAHLDIAPHLGAYFGEDQARYVVVADDEAALEADAKSASIPLLKIGTVTDGDESGFGELKLQDGITISLKELFDVNEALLPQIATAS